MCSDMESAQGILSVMAQAGLELGADTYTTLLCGYARAGDIEAINKTLQECDSKEIYFLDKDYLDVAYALIVNGHEEHVPLVLEKVRKAFGYNQVSGYFLSELWLIYMLNTLFSSLFQWSYNSSLNCFFFSGLYR